MTETIGITVYQSQQLRNRHGRTPERIAVTYLEGAIERAGYRADVRRRFDPIDIGTEQAACGSDSAYWEWRDMVNDEQIPTIAKDSNVLLTTATGGGCSAVGGNVSVSNGARLTGLDLDYQKTGRNEAHNAVHALLHEVGHNLGASHDHQEDVSGPQHRGWGWNEPRTIWGYPVPHLGGEWHRTPCVAGNGAENDCGEYVPERKYDDVVYHQYWHDCMVEKMEIADEVP